MEDSERTIITHRNLLSSEDTSPVAESAESPSEIVPENIVDDETKQQIPKHGFKSDSQIPTNQIKFGVTSSDDSIQFAELLQREDVQMQIKSAAFSIIKTTDEFIQGKFGKISTANISVQVETSQS